MSSEWILSEKEDVVIRASVEEFKDTIYMHVRKYWKGNPTRTGVSLKMEEWNVLRDLLKMDPEIEMAIDAAVVLCKEKLPQAIRESCDGCQNSWGSQRDHECIMGYNSMELWT